MTMKLNDRMTWVCAACGFADCEHDSKDECAFPPRTHRERTSEGAGVRTAMELRGPARHPRRTGARMIVRIGKHDVELVAHEMDSTLFVGTIGDFKINIYPYLDGHVAVVSLAADEDGFALSRVCASTIRAAAAEAMERAIAKVQRSAEAARREHERLDIHAMNVAHRMRETAAVAERARRLIDG